MQRRNTCVLLLFLIQVSQVLAQTNDDYWLPRAAPGNDTSRMKTLDEIEPRQMIKSLPCVISNSGAYYLPKSLSGKDGSYGIMINCSDVKIDLNGFSLNGVSNNSQSAIMCGDLVHNITVLNGTVRHWQRNGVDLSMAHESRLEGVTAFNNGQNGIMIGGHAYVKECGAFINGGTGIVTSSGCSIMNCSVANSGCDGIYAGGQSKISACISSMNGWAGIMADDYCTIRDCTTTDNIRDGIRVKNKCRVEENSSGQNGWAGIMLMGQLSRIERNSVTYNAQGGIKSELGVGNNLIIMNTVATSQGIPGFSTPNDYVGAVIPSNQLNSAFSNSNPWSNFMY